MARPKVHGDRIATQIRVPVELHERLVAVCEEREITINYLMCKAASVYLDQMQALP